MANIQLGEAVPITLQLSDTYASAVVKARLYDHTNAELAGSPVTLSHVANGLYAYVGFAMPNVQYVVVQYIVYLTGGVTVDTNYGAVSEVYALANNEAIATAVAESAAATPFLVDVRKVNGYTITGEGTAANPWGP